MKKIKEVKDNLKRGVNTEYYDIEKLEYNYKLKKLQINKKHFLSNNIE